MIAFRRTIAVLLALIVVVLVTPLLVIYRVNSTAANPDFYIRQLQQADVYNFIYDEALPEVIQDAAPSGSEGANVAWVTPFLAPVVQETFPPEWLQTTAETIIRAIIPYVVGDTDTFTVAIPVRDRLEAGTQSLKTLVRRPEFTDRIYEQVENAVTRAYASSTGPGTLPPIDPKEVASYVRRVLPPEWLASQIDAALAEIVPYLVQDKNSFTVRIEIASRMGDAQAVAADILGRREMYDFLFDKYFAGVINNTLASFTIAPGVSLSGAEVTTAARSALDYTWYQGQVSSLVNSVFTYLHGDQPDLRLSISLSDRKAALAASLAKLVDQKLEQLYNSLPEATLQQAAAIIANPPRSGLPPLRLPSVSYAQLKTLAGIDVQAQFATLLSQAIPNQLFVTGNDLGFAGPDNPLAKARQAIVSGITFTDQQLVNSMGAERIATVRKTLAGGITITEQDLQRAGGQPGGNAAEDLEQARGVLGTVRDVLTFAWIVPLLLLVALGFLGGRQWSSRMMWAAAVLLISAAVALIAFYPVFTGVAEPQLLSTMRVSGEPGSFNALLSAKANEIVRNAVGEFMRGLRLQAFIVLLVSAGLVAAGALMHSRRKEA